MLIPVAASLIIITIFLNLGFFVKSVFLAQDNSPQAKIGEVLGVSENQGPLDIMAEQNNGLNKAIVKVIEESKTITLPQYFQLPQLDQPLRKLPSSPPKNTETAAVNFNFTAEVGAILDIQGDNLYFAKRPDRAWPIASITKLFTAYTFLGLNPDWDAAYTIKPEDRREGGKIYLFSGDTATIKDLFYFSLVGSDNTATAALVRATGLSEAEFVKRINNDILALGLKNTRLVDPIGLQDGNISTAREIAQFAKIALAVPEISGATLTKNYKFITRQGKKKSIDSTDQLLNIFPENGVTILGGKTGFINISGYCLVSRFKNHEGREIITVVLGAASDSDRFDLTKKMVDLYYNNKP